MTSAAHRTSLSADGPQPAHVRPKSIHDYDGLSQPPHVSRLKAAARREAQVEPLTIEVEDGPDGFVPAFLHLPPGFTNYPPSAATTNQPTFQPTAALLLSGAGGGVTGPSSIYLSLACKLATLHSGGGNSGLGIPALRLDYRYPARPAPCVADVRAAMAYLADMYGVRRFVLVGWSFGGAPALAVAATDPRVVGCATIASQTAGAVDAVAQLAPRPPLLLHGTADRTLSPACARRLYDAYGERGSRRLHLLEGDNHALSRNAQMAETMLCEFVAECAGTRVDPAEKEAVVNQRLVDDDERHALMEKGGDLRPPESEE